MNDTGNLPDRNEESPRTAHFCFIFFFIREREEANADSNATLSRTMRIVWSRVVVIPHIRCTDRKIITGA